MSIWSRISAALAALRSNEGLAAIFDRLRADPIPERSVGFTIAIIAIGAKLAKADGLVTRDEVAAFRNVFVIPPAEETNAAKIYDLARNDVAGYDAYARKIAALFNKDRKTLYANDQHLLIDILEGLFQIAMADGDYHPREDAFLADVAKIFGLDGRCFQLVRARFVDGAVRDPYDVLGVAQQASLDQIKTAWRRAVKDCHPDVMMARGVPPEAIQLAAKRLIAINSAWHDIQMQRPKG
jgi:DnaJ like chaperone protein